LYGQGDTGPAILNPDFLSAASDSFLASMIANGRRGTAMFGWATAVSQKERLSTQDVADVIAFLRSTSASRPIEVIAAGPNFGSSERGGPLFQSRCAECHGRDGEGPKAPALNSQELINAATNGYLFATISLGRDNTAMPSWGKGSEDRSFLSIQERQDIVSFIRGWQRVVIKILAREDK
jgi:mono/diheme cytochrome c family protein